MEKPLALEAAPGWKAELGTLLGTLKGFFLGYFSLFERIMLMIIIIIFCAQNLSLLAFALVV